MPAVGPRDRRATNGHHEIMTPLNNPVVRRCIKPLDGTFCADNGSRIVVRLVPGTDTVPDVIEFRPERTRRSERLTVQDAYRIAIRARVNRDVLEKARNRKDAVARRRNAQRIKRAEKRLFA